MHPAWGRVHYVGVYAGRATPLLRRVQPLSRYCWVERTLCRCTVTLPA
jgi:hypothetical protein